MMAKKVPIEMMAKRNVLAAEMKAKKTALEFAVDRLEVLVQVNKNRLMASGYRFNKREVSNLVMHVDMLLQELHKTR
jgi:hypothetical protein